MRTSSRVTFAEVEVAPRGTRVLGGFSADYIPDNIEWAVEETRQTLRRRDFFPKRINIVLADAEVEHRLISLPPLSPKERKAVVEREVAASHSSPMVTSYVETGTMARDGGQKYGLLVVSAPEEKVTEQLSFAERLGMRPVIITTAPLALLHLCALAVEEKGIVAFFHMTPETGHIVVAQEFSYRYHRNFSLRGEREGSSLTERGDSLAEHVAFEINRTLLYARQHFRGETVEKVVLVALYPDRNMEDVETKLKELNIETDKVDLSSILNADATIEGGESPSSFVVPVGAACMKPKEKIINLIPERVKKGRRKASALGMGAIAAGIVVFSLTFAQQKLSRTLHGSQQALQSLIQEKERVLGSLERIEDTRQQREAYQKRLRFLQLLKNRSLYWPAVLRELSYAAPPEVVFSELEVKRNEGEWVLKLRGKSAFVDRASSMKALNRFYLALSNSLLFHGVRMNPPRVNGGGRQRQASGVEGPVSGNELLFELEANLAMEPLFLEAKEERSR